MRPKVRKDLDQYQCSTPGCTENHDQIHLHSMCHEGYPLRAMYDKISGTLLITCAMCDKPVELIAVAQEPPILH